MRISPVLLLLPVLVLSGACTQTVPSAIATDDRPASPQPAIASPAPAPLTIESLAGTYKPEINEQQLAGLLDEQRKIGFDEEDLRQLAAFTRSTFDRCRIIIYANGTFDSQNFNLKASGNIRLDGNKLIFTSHRTKPIKGVDGLATIPETTINVSDDRKYLLLYNPQQPSQLLLIYVKQ